MGQNSSIEWTHHTFNPWWGCIRVSPACKNCYAEAWASRFALDLWGGKSKRRFFGDLHWHQPVRWNREAEKQGQRWRVFCASMGDVFEARAELDVQRARLWDLIAATPNLDWLLLTKRPERVGDAVPWKGKWPSNIWLGTSAENQRWADKRIPVLLDYPATVRFLSCEPLLGELDLSKWLGTSTSRKRVNWVITGGESGHGARPTQPSWVTSLRDQCVDAGTPFFFKQWGNWLPQGAGEEVTFKRVPKHVAGRSLDGLHWDELPQPVHNQRKAAE